MQTPRRLLRPWVHLTAAGSDCPNGACHHPEVPLALSIGVRRWLRVCFGFHLYLILFVFFRLLQTLPGTTEKGFAS